MCAHACICIQACLFVCVPVKARCQHLVAFQSLSILFLSQGLTEPRGLLPKWTGWPVNSRCPPASASLTLRYLPALLSMFF